MIQQIELGANAGGTLDAITHEATTVTSQYEDFYRQETGWSGLLFVGGRRGRSASRAPSDVRRVP
jgi:xanthine dehydrogenase YagR molybdenum-binding subunit